VSEIFIGRQPIYDRKLGVYAYELLFRAADMNTATITDGDKATSDVIINTFLEIGLDNIVGDRLAFIGTTGRY
jgi:EAL and modified HD-GYP domain-containing signal transduction protein